MYYIPVPIAFVTKKGFGWRGEVHVRQKHFDQTLLVKKMNRKKDVLSGCAEREQPAQVASRVRGRVTFNSPLFSEGDFELRVLHDKVCLEFVQVDAEKIHGYIRVLNTAYEKDVTVYYTESEWKMVHTTKVKVGGECQWWKDGSLCLHHPRPRVRGRYHVLTHVQWHQ